MISTPSPQHAHFSQYTTTAELPAIKLALDWSSQGAQSRNSLQYPSVLALIKFLFAFTDAL